MNTKAKKPYEKPVLEKEKLFTASAATKICCKEAACDTTQMSGMSKSRATQTTS